MALSRRQLAALLLLILGSGLWIMLLTRGWIRSVPTHDHIVFGAPYHALGHHAHEGDELAAALVAWSSVEQPATDAVADGSSSEGRVISVRSSASVLVEMLALTLIVALAATQFGPLGHGRFVAAGHERLTGRRLAPPIPPPRAV